jgi:hypothetical protein
MPVIRNALVIAWLGLVGCGPPEGEAGCLALVDTYATRLVECGEYETYEDAENAIYTAFFESGGWLTCRSVDELRDPESFYDECLPALETLDCDPAAPSPAACSDQLIVHFGD